jgi:flagellin
MATPRINHNTHLREIHRTLAVHSADTSRQIAMLSSGLRVNRSSDDPASLALANGIHSEVRAMAEGTRNIQQTFSLIQVADGSLNEISAMVNRMRSLAMQGASSIFNNTDRLSINSEFNELRREIDRIASATTYNGRRLPTGGNNTLSPESTALAAASTTGLTDIRVTDAEVSTYTFVDEPDDGLLTLGNGVHTQSVAIDRFLNEEGEVEDTEFHKVRFDRLGVEVTLTGSGVPGAPGRYSDGVLDAQTLIVDQDDSLTFQVGPSGTSNDVSRVIIRDMRATGPGLNLANVSIGTRIDALNALTVISQAIGTVTAERNRLGSFQNRLQLSISTSQSVIDRMVETESRIREVDVARAASRMTHSQILAQAATSIAGTAGADIERILTLLR